MSINLAGDPNDFSQYGVTFRTHAGEVRPATVVDLPPAGYQVPPGINVAKTPPKGLCLTDGSGRPDCTAHYDIVFPTGATNVTFDIVGGYTDGFCRRTGGTINGADVLVTFYSGFQFGDNPVDMFFNWTRPVGPLSWPFQNLTSVEIWSAQRVNSCGLGNDAAGTSHPGGIALANIEYDLLVPDGTLFLDAVDPACESATQCFGTYINPTGVNPVGGINPVKLPNLVSSPVTRTGAVADGATKLMLRVQSDVPVLFELTVSPLLQASEPGTLMALDGQSATSANGVLSLTVQPTAVNGKNWALALYQTPLDIVDTASNQATVTIDAITVSGPTATAHRTLQLVRPLAVMVHGVWSSGLEAWSGFRDFLSAAHYQDCPECIVDYGSETVDPGPAGSAPNFDPKKPSIAITQLKRTRNLALLKLRRQNIAATQVDIVAHSMGGLVARARVAQDDTYRSSANYFAGEFHKILTVGTPHKGTALADVLVQNKCTAVTVGVPGPDQQTVQQISVTLEQFFSLLPGRHPIGDAIYGFQTNGPDIDHLGRTNVPSHAIAGIAPATSADETFLNRVASMYHLGTTIDALLGPAHDSIVPYASQAGGLSGLNRLSSIAGVTHSGIFAQTGGTTGETQSVDTWTEMLALLRAPVFADPNVSRFGSFSARVSDLQKYVKRVDCPVPSASGSSSASSNVAIQLTPADQSVVAPGDVVPISFLVTGAAPFDGALIAIGREFHSLDGLGPFTVDYQAAANKAGRVDILAQTFGSGPVGYRATGSILVVPTGTPANLTASQALLEFTDAGERDGLTIIATYPAGPIDVSSGSAGTTYSTQSGTSNVVAVNADGGVEARGSGTDVIVVSHGGLTTQVPVTVTITNRPPALAAIADVTMPSGSSRTVPISAADPDGDALRLFASNVPPFATLIDRGDGTGLLTLNPASADAGVYSVGISAVDNGTPPAEDGRSFALIVTAPPAVAVQPVNQHVGAGQNAVFTLQATGTPIPAYRWQVSANGGVSWNNLADGVPYSGTDTSTLLISTASTALSTLRFRCTLSNASGSAVSNSATLTVDGVSTAPGRLDLSFGAGGKTTTSFGPQSTSGASAVAVQPDGKIVVAGYTRKVGVPDSADFAIARYNQDGTLDPTFGTDGKVTTDFFLKDDAASGVAVAPDGRIVVVGYETGDAWGGNPAGTAFAIARYLPDGSLDPTFGNGGKVITRAGTAVYNPAGEFEVIDSCEPLVDARAVVIQPDGKIVVGGEAMDEYLLTALDAAVVRYNADGSLDQSFKSNVNTGEGFHPSYCTVGTTQLQGGVRLMDAGLRVDDFATSVALTSDGKIVVGGTGNQRDSLLVRLNPDGTPDSTFGDGGLVVTNTDSLSFEFESLNAVAVQPDGLIVSAGMTLGEIGDNDYYLATMLTRHDRSGRLDPQFGPGGIVRAMFPDDVPFQGSSANGLVLDAHGRIVTAGSGLVGDSTGDFRITRFVPSGAIDGLFNAGSYVTTDFFGRYDEAAAVTLTSDGHIVAAGYASLFDDVQQFAIARYQNGEGVCSFSVSFPGSPFPAAGGHAAANVTTPSGCPWTASSGAPWLTVTNAAGFAGPGLGGIGPSWVDVTAAANPDASRRTGSVTVAGQTVQVSQFGLGAIPTITTQPVNQTVPSGSTALFTVGATATEPLQYQWQTFSSLVNRWVSISDGFAYSGTTTTTLHVVLLSETAGAQFRAIAYTAAGAATSNPATLTASASSCHYRLGAVSASIGPAGGSGTVVVVAPSGCAWTAVSQDSFLSVVENAAGIGSELVSYSVAANVAGPDVPTTTRVGTIVIAGLSFAVTQNGCGFGIFPAGRTIGSAASSNAITVDTPDSCPWNVGGLPAWVSAPAGTTGAGPGPWTFTAQANTTGAARSQTISVAGQPFALKQLPVAIRDMHQGGRMLSILSGSQDQVWGSLPVVEGRSYCASAEPDRLERNRASPTLAALRSDGTTALAAANGIGSLACFVAPSTETVLFQLVQQEAGARAYRVATVESTLWANWFYTGASYSSYTILRNTTDTVVHAAITWRSDAGASVGTESVTIAPRAVVLYDARAKAPGTAGSVEVAHDGEPFALAGSQTTLSALTGLSFDTVFRRRRP